MLKKVNKSLDNQYGLLNSNIDFPNKPCILGIVPSMTNQRMSNGYLNLFMYLLQIRKQGEIDSDYDLSDIPFDLLISEQNDKTDITILNSIPINNINEAKKIMRNINIISYCLGNSTTGNMLNKLYSGLSSPLLIFLKLFERGILKQFEISNNG